MMNVNGRFLTQQMTGSQRYAYEVTRRLISMRGLKKDMQVFMPLHKGPIPGDFAGATRQFGRLKGHPWEQLELGRLANKRGGVLWSPVNVGPVNAKRHVVSIHDVFSIQFPQWVGKRFHLWYSLLLPKLASAASQIITVSGYSKETIVETLKVPEEKVSVIYPGVDANFGIVGNDEVCRVRQKYKLPADFILTVGSLEPRKNLERVVDAWLQLDGRDKPPLVVAGGVGSQRVFGKHNTEGLQRHENIKLLGYVPEEDLPGLYTSATVFVYASLLEGFGLPPLEAMACGATVVTSRTSAMRETSEGEALMVEPAKVDSIADGMMQAYRNGQTSTEREQRAERVKNKFNWTSTAEQVAAILKRHE